MHKNAKMFGLTMLMVAIPLVSCGNNSNNNSSNTDDSTAVSKKRYRS